jgi:hypothetical protein
MALLLQRLFLLLLLACEWYGDPDFGNNPYSSTLRSQPVVNVSALHQQQIARVIRDSVDLQGPSGYPHNTMISDQGKSLFALNPWISPAISISSSHSSPLLR